MPESRIVWLREPSAFPWVRVAEPLVTARHDWAKKWFTDGILLGYAELDLSEKAFNRRFRRRCFYVRDTDYPFGDRYRPEDPGRPSSAVDPLTLEANVDGEFTERSRTASADMSMIHQAGRKVDDGGRP